MVKVNPKVEPTPCARKVEADIRANGGTLTAEQWQHTEEWERFGWAPSRTGALKMAPPDGCITGEAGSWSVYRPRCKPCSLCGKRHRRMKLSR